MKQQIINILRDSESRLETLKKSEMKLSERIKIEISIRNIRIVINILSGLTFQNF